MALTRKKLTAMGIEDDKIDLIIEAHSETVNGLKDEIAQHKEKADKLEEVEKELNEAKKTIVKLENTNTDDGYKEKYEEIKKEYDDYKADIDAKELSARKDTAYRNLMKEVGVSEKRYDSIMRVTKLDDIEMDGDNIKDADKIKEDIKAEWSDFIVTETKRGANSATPPTNQGNGGTMTKEEIRKIQDPQARQKAMIENKSLFGLE